MVEILDQNEINALLNGLNFKEENKDNVLKQKEEELEKRIANRNLKIEELLKLIETLPDEFSINFIKEKVQDLLKSFNLIKEVKNLDIKGNGNEIILESKVTAEIKIPKKKKPVIKDVGILATFKNNNDSVVVKIDKIDVMLGLNTIVKKSIQPYLERVSGEIKKFIEKEENKKVEKIWIEDGELKVLYKKIKL